MLAQAATALCCALVQVRLAAMKRTLDSYKNQVEALGAQIGEFLKTVFAVRFRCGWRVQCLALAPSSCLLPPPLP